MVMNGFDTNFDGSNEVYAVNTVGFHHVTDPVRVKRDELVRIYLVNVLEFDPLNSFHLHANFFHYFPTGTSLQPTEFTDTVIQGQGQRGILELRFPYPGQLHVPRPRERVRRARAGPASSRSADGGDHDHPRRHPRRARAGVAARAAAAAGDRDR